LPKNRQKVNQTELLQNGGVFNVAERLVTAYIEVRQHMQRSAEKNKRYYDLGLRPKEFEVT